VAAFFNSDYALAFWSAAVLRRFSVERCAWLIRKCR
jgi:hypothetical protein